MLTEEKTWREKVEGEVLLIRHQEQHYVNSPIGNGVHLTT